MRSSGRQYFKKAVKTYDDKPRKVWVFDYPAQAALCGIQIWWTTETNDALFHLELGHENALKEYNKKQVKTRLYSVLIRLEYKQIKFSGYYITQTQILKFLYGQIFKIFKYIKI